MSAKYLQPTEEMTTSEKTAHCLKWFHDRSSGVRVSWRDLIKARDVMPSLPNTNNAAVKAAMRNTHNIAKVMRAKYSLDIDANKDGVRILESVEDKTKFVLAKKVKKMTLATRSVEENAQFILKDRKSFRDTAEGRSLKRFAEKASAAAQSASAQLPGLDTNRLLTSGDD